MKAILSNTISLHSSKGCCDFQPEKIIRLEAKSNYTKIFFAGQYPLLIAKVLKEFEPALMPYGFVRVHRSHLVNPLHIQSVNKKGEVTIPNATLIPVSKRKKTAVIKILRA